MTEARIVLHCRTPEECLELVEHIISQKGVATAHVSYEIKGRSVIIRVYGPGVEVARVRNIVRNAFAEWNTAKAWERGAGRIPLSLLAKRVGRPFISDALVEVLKILGHKAEIVGDELVTDAPPTLVEEVANGLAEKLRELNVFKPRASRTAKALITAYAFLTGVGALQAMSELEGRDAIAVEGHRVVPKGEWRALLRKYSSP